MKTRLSKYRVRVTILPSGHTETVYSSFSEPRGNSDFDNYLTWAREKGITLVKVQLTYKGKALRNQVL